MDPYLLFLGLIALAVSVKLVRLSEIFKLLGFKVESKAIFRDAVNIALIGFILFSVAQPPVILKSPSTELFAEH